MNIRVKDYLPINYSITPADATGFSTNYETENIDIATIDENGYITGVSAGETKVIAKVYNPKSSTYVAPDFTREFTITVAEKQELDIMFMIKMIQNGVLLNIQVVQQLLKLDV